MKPYPYNGWITVDKPLGVTSTQVVSCLRKALSMKKIGHAGTLDPLATGALLLAVGEATKTIPLIQNYTKTYEFEVTWGESRTTDDAEGEVIDQSAVRPTLQEICSCISKFEGKIMQLPPKFSALKVAGKRAYDLARQGEDVSLKARPVHIHSLSPVSANQVSPMEKTSFKMTCGKGTYVRSLARDLAEELGTVGYVSRLRRTQVGPFSVNNSIEYEKILELGPQLVLNRAWTSICKALDDILAITVSDHEAKQLQRGQSIERPNLGNLQGQALCIGEQNQNPVAIVRIKDAKVAPQRVFNLV